MKLDLSSVTWIFLPAPKQAAGRVFCSSSLAVFPGFGEDIAQNPLIPECFKHVVEGGELSETATDIVVEVLRMCATDISMYQPVIQASAVFFESRISRLQIWAMKKTLVGWVI